MNKKHKYIDLIQNIIDRMAKNSFSLKGWTVTIVSAILILSRNDTNKLFLLIAYIPLLFFWILDAYYLQIERKYRTLYNNVIRINDENEISYDLNVKDISNNDKSLSLIKCIFSKTELFFYLPLFFVLTVVICLIIIGICI